jgi:hypothetical protein
LISHPNYYCHHGSVTMRISGFHRSKVTNNGKGECSSNSTVDGRFGGIVTAALLAQLLLFGGGHVQLHNVACSAWESPSPQPQLHHRAISAFVSSPVRKMNVKNDDCKTRLYIMMNNHHHHHHHFSLDDWGLTRTKYNRPLPPPCPVTVQDVVNGAFDAIAGTLYDKQQPDPAAEHQSDQVTNNSNSVISTSSTPSTSSPPSLFSYRPLRSPPQAGRIGIELEGAEYLFDDLKKENQRIGGGGGGTLESKHSSRAHRRWAVLLAMKLATHESWKDYDDRHAYRGDEKQQQGQSPPSPPYRPVILSFNTLKEALLARGEMQYVQQSSRQYIDDDDYYDQQVFDYIVIQTISDGLPAILHRPQKKRRRVKGIDYSVNPTKGLLILCSPTDYSHEYEPPGPAVHSLTEFQKTAAMALIHETPVVVLSPRFVSFFDETTEPSPGGYHYNSRTSNQNGYQQAGYYGGNEPPRGMSPWLMRDFFPPSYSWISWVIRYNNDNNNEFTSLSSTCRIIMTNSVMNKVRHFFCIFNTTMLDCITNISMHVILFL